MNGYSEEYLMASVFALYEYRPLSGDRVCAYMENLGFRVYSSEIHRVEIFLREINREMCVLPARWQDISHLTLYISMASDNGLMLSSANPNSDQVIDQKSISDVFIPFSNIAAIASAPLPPTRPAEKVKEESITLED